ncbi:hypothetical protein RDV89_03275 [Nocardioides zeae]|uniref:Outer membrane channel protein CpnT-like N-terminal domain-containing protein n=1 Tax=Nocardioides imazamoxiresistens TaxID=3231893 RepID=A0ABU3PS62_9ACTN|nr:papain-like cysteine protease family protein [Nocardioides zeae]MDT9592070.1 hypothetical protein [Nocardioides zeae]
MTTLDRLEQVGEATVVGLRALLAELQDIDFMPPWEVPGKIVGIVSEVLSLVANPPEPSPETIEDARAAWRQVDQRVDAAVTDLGAVRTDTTPAVWAGEAGTAFRSSVTQATTRIETIATAATAVDTALVALVTPMTEARRRHGDGQALVAEHLEISWSDLTPWGLADYLRGVAGAVIGGVQELIGAYEDADAAVETAETEIRAAVDCIDLPSHLPGGHSAVDVVNGWDDDRGPLSGTALDRYDAAYAALTPEQRAAVDAALAAAGSDLERAYILQAVASGMSGETLDNYVAHLATMDRDEIEDLDPLTQQGSALVQPDQTTCGSSSLVMAKMLNDPAYALWMQTGYDPATGETDDRSFAERFGDESLAMHDRTNAATDRDGDRQQEWPDFLGTAPWGVSNEMSADGGSGVPGTEYGSDVVNPLSPGDSYDAIQAANESGHAVPLYVGDQWSPRHVVLVTGTDGDDLTIFDPADGRTTTVSRADFEAGTLGVSGWDQPWVGVVPQG